MTALPLDPAVSHTMAPNGVTPARSAALTIRTPSMGPFCATEQALGSGIYYMQFSNGNLFGTYAFMQGSASAQSAVIYHFDMGYESILPADGPGGVYMYDHASGHWFYTSSSAFPFLYDFTLNAWIYYLADRKNPGHYTANPRYFMNINTSKIFTM
jgi:hypothetical protein